VGGTTLIVDVAEAWMFLYMCQYGPDNAWSALDTLQKRINIWLVVSTPLKNMKVGWDYYSKYMEK